MLSFLSLFTLLPLVALAAQDISGRQTHTSKARLARRRGAAPQKRAAYERKEHYTGDGLIDAWGFYSGDDPTHGQVNYVTKQQAKDRGLAYTQDDGTLILKVDDFTTLGDGEYRDSIRLSSPEKYNKGLFIASFWAAPHGCSTWPAYWSLGSGTWPETGEIDLLESVNERTENQYTLHTSPGCAIASDVEDLLSSLLPNAKIAHPECGSSGSDNTGCQFQTSDNTTFGHGFNMQAGGIIAHEMTGDTISVWQFSRYDIPDDITEGNPDPSKWGSPSAKWTSDACDLSTAVVEQSLILDITLCGDWAGGSYSADGCPGTCSDAVKDPANFKHAQWMVDYIDVYQN